MGNKLVVASAGAGKSSQIAKEAVDAWKSKKKVLLLTYTKSNQKELLRKICDIELYKPSALAVKGWFTFLLEDMIRPYQRCVFERRISSINFNSTDPHKEGGKTIKGRTERLKNGSYNPTYFLTSDGEKAHTTYLAKLACTIEKESGGKPTRRLKDIYDAIYIDEVQDLVGWDFELLKSIVASTGLEVHCFGDFRQTIYKTSPANKKPKLSSEKLDALIEMGFAPAPLNQSYRCIQEICNFADRIHEGEPGYIATESRVGEVPASYAHHLGIFKVSAKNVRHYIAEFKPVILRVRKTKNEEICRGNRAFNFGESKGMGFERILIIPTDKQRKFLAGNVKIFDKDKTEKAKNSFYVAVTRARYSVAFLIDEDISLNSVETWEQELREVGAGRSGDKKVEELD